MEKWKLVRVNEHFDALIDALERAESKGYLPDAMKEEWANFACDENVAALASDAAGGQQADALVRDYVHGLLTNDVEKAADATARMTDYALAAPVAADAAAQPCGVCEGDCGAEVSGYACAVQTDERTMPSDASITACALMIKGICMTSPREEWLSKIEARIRFMLTQISDSQGVKK